MPRRRVLVIRLAGLDGFEKVSKVRDGGLRTRVADTLLSRDDLDDEMNYLCTIILSSYGTSPAQAEKDGNLKEKIINNRETKDK